jgi:hypothetical protein
MIFSENRYPLFRIMRWAAINPGQAWMESTQGKASAHRRHLVLLERADGCV